MVWVLWQAKSWQKSLRASTDAAIAQTSKWWHNCRCCFDTTCFTVMTAMPFRRGWWHNRTPSYFPQTTHRSLHAHKHVCRHMHTGTHKIWQGLPSTGPSSIFSGVKPAGKGTATGELFCSLRTKWILRFQSENRKSPPVFHQTHNQRKDGLLPT